MENNQNNELDPRIQVQIHKYLMFCENKLGTYVILMNGIIKTAIVTVMTFLQFF